PPRRRLLPPTISVRGNCPTSASTAGSLGLPSRQRRRKLPRPASSLPVLRRPRNRPALLRYPPVRPLPKSGRHRLLASLPIGLFPNRLPKASRRILLLRQPVPRPYCHS